MEARRGRKGLVDRGSEGEEGEPEAVVVGDEVDVIRRGQTSAITGSSR